MSKDDPELTNVDARMMRWIDGEMDATERSAFEADMARHDTEGDVIGHMAPGEEVLDPERIRAEKEAASRIRALLQSGFSSERGLTDGDAFNKGISDRIRNRE